MSPFWKRKAKASEKVDLNKIDLVSLMKEVAPSVLKKDEIPCLGHVIDQVEVSLVNNMRPLLTEAYDKGVLHLIPVLIASADVMKFMSVSRLIDNKKFHVERYVEPRVSVLFELRHSEEFRHSDAYKRGNSVIDKEQVWKELSGLDPVFQPEEPLRLKESLKFTIWTTYGDNLVYRISEFENEKKAVKFFETTDASLKKIMFLNAKDAAVKKYVSDGMTADEARKRVQSEKEALDRVVLSVVNRNSVKGVEVLVHKSISNMISLAHSFQYMAWWQQGKRVFYVMAKEDREKYNCFHALFKLFSLNSKHLKAD